MHKINQLFIRGFIALIPLVMTIYVLEIIYSFLDRMLRLFIRDLFGITIPGVGFVASILLILFMGFIVTNVVGARLVRYGEKLIGKLPLVQKIYFSIKQITDSFSMQSKHAFRKVVMVEYPRKGIYSIGFLINETRSEIQSKVDKKLITVFVPTTPNPTTGFLLIVPEDEIIELDITIEEGLKFILSAGMVTG